jgi:hypothetical protein
VRRSGCGSRRDRAWVAKADGADVEVDRLGLDLVLANRGDDTVEELIELAAGGVHKVPGGGGSGGTLGHSVFDGWFG